MTIADQDRRARRFEQIVVNSPGLKTVLEQVERVAAADSTVLIQGETGTGKELIAHAIHNASPRSGQPRKTRSDPCVSNCRSHWT